ALVAVLDGREIGPVALDDRADLAGLRPQAAPHGRLQALQRPAVRGKSGRRGRALPQPAGEGSGAVRRREEPDPGLPGVRSGRLPRRARGRYARFQLCRGRVIGGQPATEAASANGRPWALRTPSLRVSALTEPG